MRSLASVRKIREIKTHPNADSLELAIVDGWQCVVAKGEFSPGDCVVYFEVDSVLAVREEFEFLRPRCYVKKDWLPNEEGFRLKTIKLRGELSQGLVMPISILPPDWYVEGADVTEILGVEKWDPPLPAAMYGQAKGTFPSFIPKTEQERAQNILDRISAEANLKNNFEVSIKLDGTSCTIYRHNGEFGVCSRNIEYKINEENSDNVYVKIFNKHRHLLEKMTDGYAIQGEIMGPGIQGNREGFKDHRFFIFDIFNISEKRYLSHHERVDVLLKLGAVDLHVPVLDLSPLPSGDVNELLDMSSGPSIFNNLREGLVWKREDGSFSFKTISNDFLLKEDKKSEISSLPHYLPGCFTWRI